MWKLQIRPPLPLNLQDPRPDPAVYTEELVTSLREAARRVATLEETPDATVWFAVLVDPDDYRSDAELLQRMSYHGKRGQYFLDRAPRKRRSRRLSR